MKRSVSRGRPVRGRHGIVFRMTVVLAASQGRRAYDTNLIGAARFGRRTLDIP